MSSLLYLLSIPLLYLLIFFLIVLFHELGHAFGVIAYSKDEVNIYIGSYGDRYRFAKIRLGRLITNINANPLTWIRGRCVPSKADRTIGQQVVYIVAGPVASILTGLIALLAAHLTNQEGMEFKLFYFGVCSVFIGLFNFIPMTLSQIDSSGHQMTTDGAKLLQLFRLNSFPPEYRMASAFFNKRQYAESAKALAALIEGGNNNKHVLRLAVSANIHARNFQHGEELSNFFLENYHPSANDYLNAGYLKSMSGNHEASLQLYKKSQDLSSNSFFALNNIGHALIQLGRYREAVEYLDAANKLSPKFCHSRSNLALAKIHLGEMEEALQTIEHCLKLNPDFPDVHTVLGIYYMKMNDLTEAKSVLKNQ